MESRLATERDCPLLAELNHQLIQDEGHRNRMTVPELEERMRHWLAGEYQGVLFEDQGEVVAYALFREQADEIYLRQLFVVRHRRRQGLGRQAVQRLRSDFWPGDKRLTVEVLAANPSATAFWRAVGFADYSLKLEMLPGNDTPVLRRLATGEADLGYAVYLEACRWLNERGIRQWLVPLGRDVYDGRQKRGENFGLFLGGELAVVCSLVQGTPTEWADLIAEPRTWWLQSLATAPLFRSRGLGAVVVRKVGDHLAGMGVRTTYLDCVNVAGFLPTYYERLGFVKISEREITYPSGNRFPMVLMRRELSAG